MALMALPQHSGRREQYYTSCKIALRKPKGHVRASWSASLAAAPTL